MDLNADGDVEEDWWDGWRKKVKLAQEVEVDKELGEIGWSALGAAEGLADESLANTQTLLTSTHDELRILVQLDVSVDSINLRDQFEWDLADPQNSPEAFAAVYCSDLGLPGEFR